MSESAHPELDALIAVMARLRGEDGCAWDREQTHESLLKYLIEESHEFIDAVESGDRDHMVEELGDVLYQVLFHADLGAVHPDRPFTIEDVARVARDKMVGRHPHVFGDVTADTADEVVANWEKWKAAEKPERTSAFEGLPKGLPALALADKVIGKLDESPTPSDLVDSSTTTDQLGDLLVAIVAAAKANGLDAEGAVRSAVRRLIATAEAETEN
jgi:XTP/dITP diphosphohydrolase